MKINFAHLLLFIQCYQKFRVALLLLACAMIKFNFLFVFIIGLARNFIWVLNDPSGQANMCSLQVSLLQ